MKRRFIEWLSERDETLVIVFGMVVPAIIFGVLIGTIFSIAPPFALAASSMIVAFIWWALSRITIV